MLSFKEFITTFIIVGGLVSGTVTPVFSGSSLVVQMATLDQVLIPVAALSNQGNHAAAKAAFVRLQSQWRLFQVSSQDAFPGDKEWAAGLQTVNDDFIEAAQAMEAGNLKEVHEEMEKIRNIFEKLRQERNVAYYLDGFSRYRRVVDETTGIIAGKKAADLTDADIHFVSSMVPTLKSAWTEVQEDDLDGALFGFDEAEMAQVRSAMDGVRKDIAKLESVTPGGGRAQIFNALKALKPSLKKAFLMFGEF